MPQAVVPNVLDREFLQIRCHLLDLAAALDRIERDPNANQDDARRDLIRDALRQLTSNGTEHAESLQRIFSLPYQDDWRTKYEL